MKIFKENDKIRVLSLDGGGVRGYLTLLILRNIENQLNVDKEKIPIHKRFDLIVGTSTGGIIALALAMGKDIDEIIKIYEDNMEKVFKKNSLLEIIKEKIPTRCLKDLIDFIFSIKGFFSPKYDSKKLEKLAYELYGNATLEEDFIKTDVCITSVTLSSCKPRFYKSGYLTRNRARLNEKLINIALATSAAPTFFSSRKKLSHSANLIDGGVCANNPSIVAIIEALEIFKENSEKENSMNEEKDKKNYLDKIKLLSIGTGRIGDLPYNIKSLENGGLKHWAKPISEVLIQSQGNLVEFQAGFLLDKDNYLRINPEIKGNIALDDISKVDELKNIADIDKGLETKIQEWFN